MQITDRRLREFLKELDKVIKLYREVYTDEKKRDWRTYEQRMALRMKTASKNLKPLIEEASIPIIKSKKGRPQTFSVQDKTLVILLKHLFKLSNRNMAYMLGFFSMLSGIDVSYKTIERAYSDDAVKAVLHNLFVLLLKKKKVKNVDAAGDGTGYSIKVSQHYNSNPRKKSTKRRRFIFSFSLMDLDTKMYIAHGMSMKSERDAFLKAVDFLSGMNIDIKSMRLDKYYSGASTMKLFNKNVKFFLIPKKNATTHGGFEWRKMVRALISDPFSYLAEYFRRNNSEAGFSSDKGFFGSLIRQKREDRIDTATFCNNVWHNIFLID